ncbi:MAG: MBL fold metallo-hydrolase [Hyphomicrobiaceae bacterium]|nr:MBL fold metallo-hydrolase [Hyphomicrobiaceae bacterium]
MTGSFRVDRREFVVSATAAAAFLGINSRMVFAESPAAADLMAKGYYSFKVGDIEVTTISDGIWQKPHDPGFIKNATVEETKAALTAAGLPSESVPIPFTVTVVRTGGRTIMFDSGTGAQLAPTAGKLAANMAAAGIDAGKIDMVVITHFHPDHIFGLMQKETNAQVYPDAQIVVPKKELAWWTDPGVLAKLPENRQGLAKRIQSTLPTWKNLTAAEDGADVAPGIVAVGAYGHTPGHTTYIVGSGKDQLVVLADITNIPALFVRHPEWHAAFDGDPVMAEASRRRMFDRVIADNVIMTGYHFGMPGAGRIQKDGNGYAYVPLA